MIIRFGEVRYGEVWLGKVRYGIHQTKIMKHTKHWKYLKWGAIIFWSLFLLIIVMVNLGYTEIITNELKSLYYLIKDMIYTIFIQPVIPLYNVLINCTN